MKGMDNKEQELKQALKSLLTKEDFVLHQQLVKRMAAELQISFLDCAAALSILNYPELPLANKANSEMSSADDSNNIATTIKQKVVRYRIDVGQKHAASVETIRAILVEVSGVDKNRIGKLEVRNFYSLVDLPEGMPADIFQLLAEAEINQRKLNIKRVKYHSRFYRRNSRK